MVNRGFATAALLFALHIASVGCGFCHDRTGSAEVRSGGVVGQRFALARDVEMVRVRHLGKVMLVNGEDLGTNDESLGVVVAGTRLAVTGVERCSYPPGVTTDFTIARVEDGPFTGTSVVTNRIRLSHHGLPTKDVASVVADPRGAAVSPAAAPP